MRTFKRPAVRALGVFDPGWICEKALGCVLHQFIKLPNSRRKIGRADWACTWVLSAAFFNTYNKEQLILISLVRMNLISIEFYCSWNATKSLPFFPFLLSRALHWKLHRAKYNEEQTTGWWGFHSAERHWFLTETKMTNLKHQLIKTPARYLASCYTYCCL